MKNQQKYFLGWFRNLFNGFEIYLNLLVYSKTSISQIEGLDVVDGENIIVSPKYKFIRRASPSHCYRRVWSQWMKWEKDKVLKSDLDGKDFDFQSNTNSSERICAGKRICCFQSTIRGNVAKEFILMPPFSRHGIVIIVFFLKQTFLKQKEDISRTSPSL